MELRIDSLPLKSPDLLQNSEELRLSWLEVVRYVYLHVSFI